MLAPTIALDAGRFAINEGTQRTNYWKEVVVKTAAKPLCINAHEDAEKIDAAL